MPFVQQVRLIDMDEKKISEFFEEHKEEFLKSIGALVAIPSISTPKETGPYPFGENCARVLDEALSMGRELGFQVQNHDYYCGSILLPGEEGGEIGMFAHLDVVPEGTGWKNPPYELQIEDGWLFGRGSSDNKGPAVTALYAMRCIKESGMKLRHNIRLFLGCSEENGMLDIEYYLKHFKAPDFSFTPDASFSVCYSEKGIFEADYTAPLPEELKEFSAGTASNAVAGNAYAVLSDPSVSEPELNKKDWPGIHLSRENGLLKVEAVGSSAHAAFPEGAVNAGAMLAAYLRESGLVGEEGCRILGFPAECFTGHYGEALGIDYESEQLGRLTAVCGMIRTEGGKLRLNINIRYPAEVGSEQMAEKIAGKAASYGWENSVARDDAPSYISPDNPLVKALDEACRKQLGDSFAPYTMGGGTYARKLPNAVAFGPGIRGQKKPGPDGHGGGHQPDECVQLKVLENAFHIYVNSLIAVDKLLTP